MKIIYRCYIIAVLCLLAQVVSGQTLHDALRFSREDLYGTARSMAMGNAMTAIGGDIGALTVNPAASGVYRYSEFVITPGLDTYTGTSEYLGFSNKQSKTRFNLGSVGFVGNVKTGRSSGLVCVNWGVAGNQTAGYVSRTSAYGQDATSSWQASKAHAATNYYGWENGLNSNSLSYSSGAPWDINGAYQAWQISNFPAGSAPDDYTWYLANTENMDLSMPQGRLDQQYSRESWGYTYDITANVSFNISNKFFFGFNLTTQSIYYTDKEYYREQAVDKSDFETGFEYMDYRYDRTTRGVGFKLSAGFIYRPFAGLSIGASISTPIWKRLKDFWIQDVSGYTDLYRDKDQYSNSPEGSFAYRLNTPFQWNVGLGYTFGQRAVISVDYSNTNLSNVVFKQDNAGADYSDLNSSVKTILKTYHTVRAGLEVRVVKGISLRGGYNYMTSPIDTYMFYGDDLDRYCSSGRRQSWSAGIGYRTSSFFVDVAFQQQLQNVNEYLLYDDYNNLRATTYKDPATQDSYDIYTRDGDYILAPTLRESFKPWKLLISIGFKF